jgi:hypothetical protein
MRTFVSAGVALLLLSACTPTDKPDKRPPKSARAAQHSEVRPSAPVDEPEPSAVVEEAPAVKPAPSQWWCVCFQSEVDGEPRATTSCRELESECRALEARVRKGGRGLITGSVSHACRVVQGEHPGDALGGRELWQPSKRAGAWTSDGACLLSGEATAVEQDEGAGADEDDGEGWGEVDGPFSLLASESLGDLSLGMKAAQVSKLLGDPASKGAVEEWAATGEFAQEWRYPDLGLSLFMSASTRHGPQTLSSLRAKAPSTLLTARKIGIGSTRAAVEAAYGDVQDEEGLDPGDDSMFVAGSIYGGVFFGFEEGKVESIFMGAGAE